MDGENIPCAILKRRGSWVISVYLCATPTGYGNVGLPGWAWTNPTAEESLYAMQDGSVVLAAELVQVLKVQDEEFPRVGGQEPAHRPEEGVGRLTVQAVEHHRLIRSTAVLASHQPEQRKWSRRAEINNGTTEMVQKGGNEQRNNGHGAGGVFTK
jgi:hypothetical protein